MAGRFYMSLGVTGTAFPEASAWTDTIVALPPERAPKRYMDIFTGRTIESHRGSAVCQLALTEVFALMPVAMLVPTG